MTPLSIYISIPEANMENIPGTEKSVALNSVAWLLRSVVVGSSFRFGTLKQSESSMN